MTRGARNDRAPAPSARQEEDEEAAEAQEMDGGPATDGDPEAGAPRGESAAEEAAAEGRGEAAPEPMAAPQGAELRRAVEALLFSVSEPITIRSLGEILGASLHELREAVEELRLEYIDSGRAFRIEDIAGGVQLLTLSAYDPWIRRLRQKEREGRLSAASLETLAVIAYKQPINKADLEGIRGVNCSPTLKTLLDRGLVQVVGRGEGLGKPLLYGTTHRFLESFGLASIRDLPQPELEQQLGERLAERQEERQAVRKETIEEQESPPEGEREGLPAGEAASEELSIDQPGSDPPESSESG